MPEITILDIVLGCFTIVGGTFGAVCGAIAIAEEEEQNRNGFLRHSYHVSNQQWLTLV